VASSLAERLKTRGYGVFLDFSSQYGIEGGESWERAIWDAIRNSAAVLLCCTPNVIQSKWAFAEVMIARYEGKRVFPLLLQGDSNNIWETLRATTQFISFTEDPEVGYQRLFDALKKGKFAVDFEQKWDVTRPPYSGLQSLQAKDAPTFFARRQDAENIINFLQPRPGGFRHKSLAIIGPSGSGKSSLLKAGVLPKLLFGAVPNSVNWVYSILSPGDKPFFKLAEAIKRAVPDLGFSVRTIEDDIQKDSDGLSYVVTDALILKPENSYFLLYIDQLEELLTRSKEDDASKFISMLVSTINSDARFIVLSTLRADFYAALLNIKNGSDFLKNIYSLGPLGTEGLRDVIQSPAKIAGITFQDGLIQRILDDAETSDALSLLSFTLRSMYDGMSLTERTFTHAAYEQLGGLQGALGKHAENTFAELTESEGNALILAILQHFVVVSPDGKAVRRKVHRNEIQPPALTGVDRFVDARLFVAGEDEEGQPTIEAAHEAIFRNWDRLTSTLANEIAIAQYLRQVLNQGVSDRQQLGVLLGPEQRKLLNKHSSNIKMESAQLELAIRSAIQANDQAKYWFERGSRESTKIWTIAKNILTNSDPTSRYHLLDLINKLLQENKSNQILLDLVEITLNSNYPALKRFATRILAKYGKEKIEHIPDSFVPHDFVKIPGGECLVGTGENLRYLNVPTFEILKYPITNIEYYEFIKATNHKQPQHWKEISDSPFDPDHPVVFVSWFDATQYCLWLSSLTQFKFRLPSELEWEKVSSWNPSLKQKNHYPWGNEFDSSRCNTFESKVGYTTPIGQYSPHGGDSYYQVSDLAGNVWEWTSSRAQDGEGKYLEYPPSKLQESESENTWGPRVQKGGTFIAGEQFARIDFRLINLPELALQDFGFRIVREN
jgi:formylglycine-generating enzyme required for sulfatase activity